MQPYRLVLFGPIRVVGPHGEIDRFDTKRSARLLARLGTAEGAVARDDLCAALWPGEPPELMQDRFRQELSRLRRALGPAAEIVEAGGGRLRLVWEKASCDYADAQAAFRRAERAKDAVRTVALCEAVDHLKGPFLAGDASEWAVQTRAEVDRKHLSARRELATLALASGHPDDAQIHARAAVALAPLDERTQGLWIKVVAQVEGPERARMEADRYRRRLRREIGETPSPSFQSVFDGLERMPEESMDEDITTWSLPVPPAPIFGREAEIARLEALLAPLPRAARRLVTLTGPGGIGKTRLALETAWNLRKAFGKRALFVPLTDLDDPSEIVPMLLAAIDPQLATGREDVERVVEALPDAPTLVLLDNFEHLVEGGAALVETLLLRKPNLVVLVTSRRPLRLVAEQELPIGPLAEPKSGMDAATVEALPSVRLFLDRVRTVAPDFRLDDENRGPVSELVARLEGYPLAIHLAASRIRTLPPEQMLTEMRDRLGFLRGIGTEFAGARHATMHEAIAYSERALPKDLRRFFHRLGAFAGGWTVAAASEVADEPCAAVFLERLVEESLVLAERDGGSVRFSMLATIRDFALSEADPEDALQTARCHAAYYTRRAVETLQAGELDRRSSFLGWFDAEIANCRAVLSWGAAHDPPTGLRMWDPLWRYWNVRGHYEEGLRWLEALLRDESAVGDEGWIARIRTKQAMMLRDQGRLEASITLYRSSLAVHERLGNLRAFGFCALNLSIALADAGDFEGCVAAAEAGTAAWETVDNRSPFCQICLGIGYVGLGRVDEALGLYREALSGFTRDEDAFGTANAHQGLGEAYWAVGRSEDALVELDAALAILRSLEEIDDLCRVLLLRGEILAAQERWDEAEESLREACVAADRMGNRERHAKGILLRARGHLAQGDRQAAARRLAELETRVNGIDSPAVLSALIECALAVADGISEPTFTDEKSRLRWLLRRLGPS